MTDIDVAYISLASGLSGKLHVGPLRPLLSLPEQVSTLPIATRFQPQALAA